jgi:two-component system alkaline phosphatase synthesis response regulator PhoP
MLKRLYAHEGPIGIDMSSTKILLVDDEQSILNLVEAYLKPEGFEVYTAADGPGGLKAAQAFKPDLIVLDIMLPGLDGLEVLRQLRKTSNAYVILLTAKTEEIDKLVGLSVGADDYLTKPFSPRELVARIKAALRRLAGAGEPEKEVLLAGDLRVDLGSRRAWKGDAELQLTLMEFDLLRSLAENSGMALSRERLLERVWGADYYGDLRVVDVHIGHLRKKLGDADLIQTVRGVGYRLDPGAT